MQDKDSGSTVCGSEATDHRSRRSSSNNNSGIVQYAQQLLEKYVPDARIRDGTLYERALTHRSVNRLNCNEQLEYLGDAVLYLAVAEYLHKRYPAAREDMLSRVRGHIIRGSTLADLCARGTQLWRYLLCRSVSKNKHASSVGKAVMEDLMEAFLGALFKDQGYQTAQAWLVAFLEDNLDFAALVAYQSNPKDQLNRHYKATYGSLPVFEALTLPCTQHLSAPSALGQAPPPACRGVGGGLACAAAFTTVVRVWDRAGGHLLATAKAADVKRAEALAAKRALQHLQVA